MKERLCIAAAADFHIQRPEKPRYPDEYLRNIIRKASQQASYLILCGDTAVSEEGAKYAADILAQATVPVLLVPGNHDKTREILDIYRGSKAITVLDGRSYLLNAHRGALHIVGTVGGYDGSFSEKIFAQRQSVVERGSAAFEKSIAEFAVMLDCIPRDEAIIIAMHYAPVADMLHKFIDGSKEFGKLIDGKRDKENTLVLHGHVHKGREVTFTPKGIPIYNVSLNVVSATQAQNKAGGLPQPEDCFRVFKPFETLRF